MDKILIGKKIKQLRREKGLTQAQLAEMINMHEKHISRIESGKYLPNFENLVNIFNFLGFDIDKIITNDFSLEKQNSAKLKLLKLINNSTDHEINVYLKVCEAIKTALKTQN